MTKLGDKQVYVPANKVIKTPANGTGNFEIPNAQRDEMNKDHGYVIEDAKGDNCTLLQTTSQDIVRFLKPCSNVDEHVTSLVEIARDWSVMLGITPAPEMSAQQLFINYVTIGLQNSAPLDYKSALIWAKEKGVAITVYTLEQDQETLKLVEEYAPNRPSSSSAFILLVPDLKNPAVFFKLIGARIFETASKSVFAMDNFDSEVCDDAKPEITAEKAKTNMQLKEKNEKADLVCIPFNMEFFHPKLDGSKFTPQQIGKLNKQQMILLKKAYELMLSKAPKVATSIIEKQKQPKPDYAKVDAVINLELQEWTPLKNIAELFQTAINENNGQPLYFKTGPYSSKHVTRDEKDAPPTNMARTGIEAVKLMCCDHRIHRAVCAFLNPTAYDLQNKPALVAESFLKDGVYELTLFTSKPNADIAKGFEVRHFLVDTGSQFVLHTTAYHSSDAAPTYNLPRNHWLGYAYNQAAIKFLNEKREYLFTVDQLRFISGLTFDDPKQLIPDLKIWNLIKDYLFIIPANFDFCHQLDKDKVWYIEQNPFGTLTDPNRFTEQELIASQSRKYNSNGTASTQLIVPGDIRVTEIDLNNLIQRLGPDAVASLEQQTMAQMPADQKQSGVLPLTILPADLPGVAGFPLLSFEASDVDSMPSFSAPAGFEFSSLIGAAPIVPQYILSPDSGVAAAAAFTSPAQSEALPQFNATG